MKSEGLTHTVIGAAMEVHSALGPGYLESIYKVALLHELGLRGLTMQSEWEVRISYKDRVVGVHRLDIVVGNELILELKAVNGLAPVHLAQTLSYMKATGIEVGLIVNFGESSLVWKRLVQSPRMSRI